MGDLRFQGRSTLDIRILVGSFKAGGFSSLGHFAWLPGLVAGGAAVVPFVFLLSSLHLPLLHLPLVDVESNERQQDEAKDEGDQDDQHDGGGKRLEELPHLCDAGAAGIRRARRPVQEARRQGEPQLLGKPGTH